MNKIDQLEQMVTYGFPCDVRSLGSPGPNFQASRQVRYRSSRSKGQGSSSRFCSGLLRENHGKIMENLHGDMM